MFFYNTYKRKKIIKEIQEIFSSAYETKTKVKVNKHIIDLVFPKYQLGVIFDLFNDTEKQKIELEKLGLKVFTIGEKESIYEIISRLIYILFNLEKQFSLKDI
jgi:hypothetical protein